MQKLFIPGLAALVFILVLSSGCIQQQGEGAGKSAAELASDKCVQLCEAEVAKGTDLGNGPCLSNEAVEGWVCDVAHSPRAAVDNISSNQCSAFGKTASYFVEVDEDCKVIKVA